MKFQSEIVYFAGALSPDMCDRITADGESLEPKKGTVATYDKKFFDPAIRDDNIVSLSNIAERKWLYDGIWDLIHRLNRTHWQFNLTYLEELQYSIYGVGGHFDWHRDLVSVPNGKRSNALRTKRKLSISIQLSDPSDYEGGDLEIAEDSGGGKRLIFDNMPNARAAIRQRGTIVGFPSALRHRVSPVVSGTRRALIAWAGGPGGTFDGMTTFNDRAAANDAQPFRRSTSRSG